MLFQIGSNQFLVIKKTWPNIVILGVGALANIVLNYVLIPIMCIEGASLAAFIGYFISITVMAIVLKKLDLMYFREKTLLYIGVFLACFGVIRANGLSIYYINIPIAIVFTIFSVLMYWRDHSKYLHWKKKGPIVNSNVSDSKSNESNTSEPSNKNTIEKYIVFSLLK